MTKPIPLRIYSDFLCPYCFLAEKQLDRLRNEYRFDIYWTGFELHPEIPEAGIRPGQAGGGVLSGIWNAVAKTAAEYSITINPPPVIPNTHLALEAAWELGQNGLAERFRRNVFDAYFINGADIGNWAVLVDLARDAGADAGRMSQVLEDRVHFDAVEANREAGYDELVTGVPTILAGGLRALGVQPVSVYRKLFDSVGVQG